MQSPWLGCRVRARSTLVLLVAYLVVQVAGLALREQIRIAGLVHDTPASCSKLRNQDTHYTVEIGVGTPQQKFDIIADTGSNALIVQSCACRKNTFMCKETEKCFVGDGKSSTYVAPKPTAPLMLVRYGTGDIVVTAATDVVQVGRVSAIMEKGLQLMLKRTFMTTYDFEGILGLGVPPPASHASSSSPNIKDKDLKPGMRVRLPSLLEIARVDMFSMCFKPGQGGALRLNVPPMPQMLKQIGRKHWSLSLEGFSVGSSSAPISVCNPKSREPDAASTCAAIPDSGTTHIMGPKEDIEQILGDVCTRWKRCESFKSKGHMPMASAEAFRKLLWDCHGWMTAENGISEVPSIFIHLQGSDGETNVLEITAMSYVYESTSMVGRPVCQPSFDTWKHNTGKHGPAWILGTPLFYEYQVGFGLRPPSIGFSRTPCTLCDDPTNTNALVLNKGLSHAAPVPRTMNGKPRLPSFDVDDEL